ncbi:MAG TPA: excinuclease ABC subunit UvrC [Clostridia bacterium]|nr:excinuclease ABC subunit UvrC [Clostridia bacterium]
MDFKSKLRDVPPNPGVYMMLDEGGNIIYVGKAKNLKNRLRQYFYVSANKTAKVVLMMQSVADFKYIITASEIDALLTENNLIKKHTPRYNILLKDDKNYPFLRIDMKEKFPTVQLVRKLKPDGAKYFGPYMLSVNIRDIIDLVHTAFKVRDCSLQIEEGNVGNRRPCLNFHLNRCLAPCAGLVSEEQYKEEMQKVIAFLKGNNREVERILQERMKEFSDEGNFEAAIICRDKLRLLDKLVRKQISSLPSVSNLDIFAMKSDGIKMVVNWIVVRGGKIVGGDNFVQDAADDNLSSFLFQFYENNAPNCDEVIVESLPDSKALEEWLSDKAGRKINVVHPKQGVRAQLVDMANVNASDRLEKLGTEQERKTMRTAGAVAQLAELLNLPVLPNRIEAYDISHISGTDKVSSMVVFENGEPKKAHYRKFKIKTVEGIDDFACMKETLLRRLNRLDSDDESFSSVPDLILIDGGKGQLSFAKKALCECGRDIAILSLAEREEEVFLDKTPILLPRDSLALGLLQRVRDEAHRFAVTFHKNLRGKRMTESVLKDIDGVGRKRIDLLYDHFKSLDNIRNASLEELEKVKGISHNIAENVYKFFH